MLENVLSGCMMMMMLMKLMIMMGLRLSRTSHSVVVDI